MKGKTALKRKNCIRAFTPEINLTEAVLPVIEHIAEQMPGGFFIYRADGHEELIFANSATVHIFGCETLEEFHEFTGFTFPGMVHPDDLREVEASIGAQILRADNRNFDAVEYRITRKDGVVRYLEDYGRFVHTEALGDLYYVFIADVTDKHQIAEENRRRAKVIEGISKEYTSIYLLDIDAGTMLPYRLQTGGLREIMDELRKQGEVKADWREILPVYAERYVEEADRERYLKEIQGDTIRRRLETEKSYQVNYRCKWPEDGLRYMRMSIVRIDENDARYAVMGYKDITDETIQVQQETQAKMRTEMELEKERRTNEAKSTFLFNVSHDIRTPMNAVMGFTALAERHMDDPELLREYLGRVEESSRYMLSLLDDLLEMSQADAKKIRLKLEPADLREELESAMNFLRPQAAAKHILLTADMRFPEGRVLLDILRFQRVMTNVIGNAVKFTPEEGAVQVTARARHTSESGYARYEITVSDNGVGMTKEFLSRIFQPFEREDTSTKTGQSGTGLGLSIAKALLDAMGGSISARSQKGQGSVFTVQLPLKLAGEAAVDVEEEAPREADARANGERRILLVEDIELNRMLAETILEEAGFLVESVPDGCDAVEAVKRKPAGYYDLVLMDIQMPVMNGYEATRAIRALERDDVKGLPILALSANAREEDKRMSLDSGMNAHLAKPFDVSNLLQTVHHFIAAGEKREAE